MKRSLWLFISVGIILLLVGAVLYTACAALGHSLPTGSASSYESRPTWSSGDTAAADLLIIAAASAFAGWLAVLFISRSHRRHSLMDCPFCRHHIHVDDRACAHCGSRFA